MTDPLGSVTEVELARQNEAWYPASLRKLESFRLLAQGWDSYEAEPPNETALYWAQRSLAILERLGFVPHRVAPSVEGGVSIAWRHGQKNANVEFFNTAEIFAATSDGSGNPHVWEVQPDELTQAMEQIREYVGG
jgi:hypothetical protein